MSSRPPFIAISGLMGSGKTTLARALAEKTGWQYLPQSAPGKKYLLDLFHEPARWAFEAQLSFFCHKAIQLRACLRRGEPAVLDRSLEEDYNIFARHFYNRGEIDARSFDTYKTVAHHFLDEIPSPDLIILCECQIQTARDRIFLTRPRDYQSLYPPDHIERIAEMYRQWAVEEPSPIYAASSDQLDWRQPEVVENIIYDIQYILRKDATHPRQLTFFENRESISASPTSARPLLLREVNTAPVQISGEDDFVSLSSASAFVRYPSVYIAAPFMAATKFVERAALGQKVLFDTGEKHGRIPVGRYQTMLYRLAQIAERMGLSPVLPHRDVNRWGRVQLPAARVVELCSDHVKNCDCFIGVLGNSHGSHYEYGLARGLEKPSILIDCEEISQSFIAQGVRTDETTLVVQVETMTEVPKVVASDVVREFLRRFVPVGQ